MLRNRFLGGASLPLPVFNRPDEGGAGGDVVDDRHTDVVLQELAGKAFDQVEARGHDGGDRGEPGAGARAAEKSTGAEKPLGTDRGRVEPGKTNPESPAAGDRGDGRTPKGTFAAKKGAGDVAAEPGTQGKPGEQQLQPGQEQQQQAPAAPPPGWSPTSKSAWDKLPAEVRADIAKRELEVSNGFKQYEGLKPFADHVAKNGQTLAQAFHAYTGIEQLIRNDIGGGLMHIVQNSGKTQHEAATLFAQLAQRLGFQFQASGSQQPGGSTPNQNGGADPTLEQLLAPVLKPLIDKVTTIEGSFTRQAEGAQTQRLTESQRIVDQFRQAPENKFYDNVEPRLFALLKSGAVERTGDLAADLKAAYEAACMADPEIRELLLNERLAAAGDKQRATALEEANRARAASRSVTGAPAAGAREQPRRGGGDKLQAAAEQAWDRVAARV